MQVENLKMAVRSVVLSSLRGDVHTHIATTNVNLTFRGVGVFLLDVCFVAKCYFFSFHQPTSQTRHF